MGEHGGTEDRGVRYVVFEAGAAFSDDGGVGAVGVVGGFWRRLRGGIGGDLTWERWGYASCLRNAESIVIRRG